MAMGKVLQFTAKPPAKFGFERVRKKKKGGSRAGQLSLFGAGGQVLNLPTNIGTLEQALLLDEREDPRAEQLYRKAIEEQDGIADAYCNLGIIESKAGRMEEAFDCFTRSLEHAPRHFESHYNLANLFFDQENFKLARLHYRLAAEVEPSFPNIYFNLGLACALEKDFPEAITAFKKYKRLAGADDSGKADELLSNLTKTMGAGLISGRSTHSS